MDSSGGSCRGMGLPPPARWRCLFSKLIEALCSLRKSTPMIASDMGRFTTTTLAVVSLSPNFTFPSLCHELSVVIHQHPPVEALTSSSSLGMLGGYKSSKCPSVARSLLLLCPAEKDVWTPLMVPLTL